MLSSPRSLGFVLAAILGAMLVPGCRSAMTPTFRFSSSQVVPDQITADRRFPALTAAD